MNENIKKFLAKVEQSPELQDQFAKIRNPDEAYKLAASIQDGFTKEEFISEMKKIYEAAIQDLSDEDIAKIAGGGFSLKLLSFVTGVSTISATKAVAYAASAM